MRLLSSERVPEPEVMESVQEAEGYEATASDTHLDQIDNQLVDYVLSMGTKGTLLDLGTGPGQIPIKLAKRDPHIRVIGIDLSTAMLKIAVERARQEQVSSRVFFLKANATSIPVETNSVDLLICNSTLHHFQNPVLVFNEVNRVVKKGGGVYFRDLRRPPRILHGLYTAFFGRRYKSLMRKLYEDSVRASYTRPELRQLVAASSLGHARVFYPDLSHIAIERRGLSRSSL